MRDAVCAFWAGAMPRSASMLDGTQADGEAEAQRRAALRAVAALADRHRAAVWTALADGAGLDEAHEAAAAVAAEAYRVLAGVGITGGRAAAEWCRVAGRQ